MGGSAPLPSTEPGEFTRMLQSPLAPSASPSQPPPFFPSSTPSGPSMPSSSEPGEFTKMLQTPGMPPSGRPPGPPQPTFPQSKPGGVNEPGEFTRMLEAPFAAQGLAAQPLAAPPPRPHATGEATRAFQVQEAQAQGGASAEEGQSEFTKMFKAPVAPPAPPEPKVVKRPAGRPPIPKKKAGNKLLWILIAIAVVLALALIVYLIVR